MKIARFADWPIATKLRLITTAVCMSTVALMCAVWIIYERQVVRRAIPPSQVVRAKVIAASMTAALAFDSPQDAQEILSEVKGDPHLKGVVIYDLAGRSFAHAPAVADAPDLSIAAGSVEGYRYGPGHIDIWTPVELRGRKLGTLVFRRDLGDLESRMETIPVIALVVMVCSGIAAYWLAGILQRLVSEPVLKLARAATRVTQLKDYTVRVPRTSADEVGQLTDAFNAMLSTIDSGNAETTRLYAEVQRHAGELEQRVKERTVELERANEELEAFGASISHDLRGPLRHIDGYAHAIVEDHSAALPPQAREYLEHIVDRAVQMNALTNALLEFSRLSRQAIRPESVEIGRMAIDVFGELKGDSPGRDLRLRVAPMPAVWADRVLLRQVLVNLLSNAIKYTRGRDAAIIEVGIVEGSRPLQYFVRDNGIGFDAAAAGKLFTAFERLHDAREYEGTGIGLATVKRIVLRHGGRIHAEATPGQGATFYFTLAA